MKVQVRVPKTEDLLVGDVVLEFTIGGNVNDRRPPNDWVVTAVESTLVRGADKQGRGKLMFFESEATDWLVERSEHAGLYQTRPVNGTFKVPTIEDWPLSCPKCGKAKSAYLGLNSYDCRWGCYARPSKVGASAKGAS